MHFESRSDFRDSRQLKYVHSGFREVWDYIFLFGITFVRINEPVPLAELTASWVNPSLQYWVLGDVWTTDVYL